MLGQYLPIFGLFLLGMVFIVGSFAASGLLAPRRSTKAKSAPYECGIEPGVDNPQRFPVRFFLVAMIFIVFDIEIIFMYPWAMIYRQLGTFGLVAIGIFSFLVFESFVYLIANGALDWGPIKKVFESRTPQVSAARTTSTTVRRVGLDGREAA